MTTLRNPKIRFEDTISQTTNHPTCLSFIIFKSIKTSLMDIRLPRTISLTLNE